MVVLNYKFELSKTFDKYSNSASNPLLQKFYYSLNLLFNMPENFTPTMAMKKIKTQV